MFVNFTINMHFIRPYNPMIAKRILSIAYPIIFANASRSIMGIVDMMMVGKLGVHSMAAVGFGEMLIFSLIAIVGCSIQISTQAITSRRYGERDFPKCFEALINGLTIGICLGLPIMIIGYTYCDNLIQFLLDDPITIRECIKYTSIQFLGILFPIMFYIFQGFYTGIQKTSIFSKIAIFSNVINIYLNLGLIFGSDNIHSYFASSIVPGFNKLGLLWYIFPFPQMGISGAALGTVISMGLSLLCFLVYLFSNEIRQNFTFTKIGIKYSLIKKQIKLTWPVMQTQASMFFGLTLFLVIMGKIGTIELAATNIMIRIYNVSCMPAIGIGNACSSLVGYYLGEKNLDKTFICIKDSLRYALLIMGTFAISWFIIPDFILSLFTQDSKVKEVGIPLLRFLAIISILDSGNVVCMSTLEGAGDVKFVSRITHIYVWIIYIPLSYLVGIYLGIGLWGAWYSFLFGFLFISIMLFYRIYKGEWQSISV